MLKVFLVEDETVIREGLRDNIPWEEYGYRFVGEAADGEMALPLIRKTAPDVLITDIKMPFMDGLSLSKIVSAEFPKTKIIIISGYDDFEYARQAIEVGVEQYLLKPITKMNLKKTLQELKEKIEQDLEQNDYQLMFQSEMHEYEQFSRRRFFEKMLQGELSVKEIYDTAAKHSIEITASCYNLLLLCLQEKNAVNSREAMEQFARKQEEVLYYILRRPQFVLFQWNVNCYGILLKSEPDYMEDLTRECIESIRRICASEETVEWYIAVGKPVERLSLLPECFAKVNHYFAYRFVMPTLHVLDQNNLSSYLVPNQDNNIGAVDPSKMNPEIIKDFLNRGGSSEIEEFVESYLFGIREAMESRMFCDYVILNIRFAILAYVDSLGVSREDYEALLRNGSYDMNMKPSDVSAYFADMLQAAMQIRNKENDYQGRKILRKALDYIDENFDKESISLNSVAGEVDISANYLSAIFSQNMQKTFVEYITAKRMEKAKKLLRGTEKSSGDIALEVGYKDPHYFSFVFKKTQGVSPREYRTGKN